MLMQLAPCVTSTAESASGCGHGGVDVSTVVQIRCRIKHRVGASDRQRLQAGEAVAAICCFTAMFCSTDAQQRVASAVHKVAGSECWYATAVAHLRAAA